MKIDFYTKTGVQITSIEVDESTSVRRQIGCENAIAFDVFIPDRIVLHKGDYCIYENEQYRLRDDMMVLQSEVGYTTRWTMYGNIHSLESIPVTQNKVDDVWVSGDLELHARFLLYCIVGNPRAFQPEYESGWDIDLSEVETDAKIITDIQYQKTNVLAALNVVCERYKYEFDVIGKTIMFAKTVRYKPAQKHILSVGRNKGLYTLEERLGNDRRIITRLIPIGGTQNLPIGYEFLELRIPEGYVEKNTDLYGVDVAFQQFPEEYPRLFDAKAASDAVWLGSTPVKNPLKEDFPRDVPAVGSVIPSKNTSEEPISEDDLWEIFLKPEDVPFDLNDMFIEGQAPIIQFNTGVCAGYPFEIIEWDDAVKKLTFTLYREERNGYTYYLPYIYSDGNGRYPHAGDEYVFLGVKMDDSYVLKAQDRLRQRAVEALNKICVPRPVYNLDVDSHYAQKNGVLLSLGEVVGVVKGESTVDLRVTGYSYPITDIYSRKYTISDEITKPNAVTQYIQSSLQETSNVDYFTKIEQLLSIAKGLAIVGVLPHAKTHWKGGSDQLLPYDIEAAQKEGDSDQDFKAKVIEAVSAFFSGNVGSNDFISGLAGKGWNITSEGNAEVRNLKVWESLQITELVKNQVSISKNETWFTDGGKIESVENEGDMQRVVYEDEHSFKPGDLLKAIVEGESGFDTARFVVESITAESVVLSSQTSIRASKGMTMARVGNISNPDRQNSIYVDALEGYIRVLAGMSSFDVSLENIKMQAGNLRGLRGQGLANLPEYGVYAPGLLINIGQVNGLLNVNGKIAADLIDADMVVARAAKIANFTIQENLLQGKDGRIVFQNENIDTLSELLSPKSGQTINVSAGASDEGTFTNTTVTDIVRSSVSAIQDFTVQYPGVLKFSIAAGRDDSFSYVEGGTPAFSSVEGEPNEYKCEVLRKTGTSTYEVIDSFRPTSNGTIEKPVYFDRTIYLPSTGEYRIRFGWESTDRIYWVKKPQDWPNDRFPILTTKLSAAITGQSPVDRTHIYYSGSDALTKIGTDGLYSFWSLYNYLYFSQSEGLKIKAGTTISSPNGEYSLTVNDQGISISGQAGTNASNNVVDFTVAGTRVNIQTGEKLSVAFGKIAKWFADLKTVAFTGSYNDLTNKPTSLPANGGHADSATKDASGNVITTTYATKTEVDQKVTGVYKFQGSVRDVAALLALTGIKRGDVYDVREAGTLNGEAILPGDNVAATADNPTITQWDKLAGKVDLSGYLQKNGDASNTIVTFEQETGEPASGTSLHSIIGRLVKKVSDIVSGTIKVAKAAAADTAPNAVNDGEGHNIIKTYATKGEITNVQIGARNYVTGLKDNWEGGIVGSDGVVAIGNNYNQVTKDYQDIAFLAGKTATVSVNPNAILSGAERLKLSFRIVFYTQDFLFISYSSGDGNTPLSLTVPDDAFYCKASVGLGVYGYVANNFDTVRFQLELGNKATDYRPAPQDIARINGDYPAMKAGKATADGDGNNIKDTYATQKGTYPGLTAGNANMAKNLKSDNNFYLGYDGTDGTGTPFVILGATGTDNYNNSTIKRVKPDSLTVGKATADANGLNIAANYTRRTYVRPGNSWDSVGWYRVYTSGVTNNPGENIDLNLITYYNYDRTQNISLRVCVGYGLVSVVQQNAFFNTPISKIRVVWKGNGTFYIDAYMKDSRGVWVCLNQTGGTGTLAETAILNPAFADGYTATEYTIIAGDRPMQLSEKAKITYSTAEPANPKEGDFWIVPTD